MAKILLVHPLFLAKSPKEQAAGSPYFPLGLLYLAAFVRDHGHDVAVFDGTFENDESAFTRALQREEPDLVGISALLPTRETALVLAKAASAQGCVVVLGGPDPTASATPLSAHRADGRPGTTHPARLVTPANREHLPADRTNDHILDETSR